MTSFSKDKDEDKESRVCVSMTLTMAMDGYGYYDAVLVQEIKILQDSFIILSWE